MHIHILGIGGTFMGGVAQIAKMAGHRVTGCDKNIYPPMSDQLQALGIDYYQGFDAEQLDSKPDLLIVGNVMSRGMSVIERMLNEGLRYTSGPQWLYEHVLHDKWVIAVSGTHGKTTTTGMLAWMLQEAGLNPGFLIGGVANNFSVSARLTDSPFFVIEADEYDTAFFDKRSKFVHYHPRTLIINNIEYDHADIFPDLDSIKRQFHHLIRMLPGQGKIIVNAADNNISDTLAAGCWSEVETFASAPHSQHWAYRNIQHGGERFELLYADKRLTDVTWSLLGEHNIHNAMAAIAAARHVGVTPEQSVRALSTFSGLKRRMELLAELGDICVYDDFAHHPTAIATTVAGLRQKVGQQRRIFVVLEPRSNTMRLGVHNEQLLPALSAADAVWLYMPEGFDLKPSRADDRTVHKCGDIDAIVEQVVQSSRAGDHILIMSNGGFQGLHGKLLDSLRERFENVGKPESTG